MEIDVLKECGQEDIISRKAGAIIRALIIKNWSEKEISLVFSGKEIGYVSFFDEAIALLLKRNNKTKEEIVKKIKFQDIQPTDRNLLNHVFIARVMEQQKDKKGF